MMSSPLVVARKELTDHLRDTRALVSSGLYALMGPAVVGLVLLASPRGGTDDQAAAGILVMASIFTLVSAFSGASSVAVDMFAGERERQSLLPLLMNAVSRLEIVVGKWLAASAFAAGSILLTLSAFAVVFAFAPGMPAMAPSALPLVPLLVVVAALAAALEVLVSTCCANVKEGNTYLSILIFVVIGGGMWLAFSPQAAEAWWFLAPVVGHQYLLQIALTTGELPVAGAIVLSGISAAVAALALMYAGRSFQRDAVVYGD